MFLERLNFENVDWTFLDSFRDRTIFQSPHWLNFLKATQNAEPVIARLLDGQQVAGYFTGCIVRKYGLLRILGSPCPGWMTSYMGFNLQSGVNRRDALATLTNFAFRDLQCAHLEFMDRYLSKEDVVSLGFTASDLTGFEIDLTKTEDELFANMTSPCRRCIRNAEKNSVVIEEASDLGFADDYFLQLRDVFAKQGLVPTYGKDRVKALIEHLLPSGMLLLLRARNAEGKCIASGISVAMNDLAYSWGAVSWRPYQNLRPNEAIQWYTMRYWKARGMARYDMGGSGVYKKKYGGTPIAIPWIRKSKYDLLAKQRNRVKRLYRMSQRLRGIVYSHLS